MVVILFAEGDERVVTSPINEWLNAVIAKKENRLLWHSTCVESVVFVGGGECVRKS